MRCERGVAQFRPGALLIPAGQQPLGGVQPRVLVPVRSVGLVVHQGDAILLVLPYRHAGLASPLQLDEQGAHGIHAVVL